MWQAKQLFSWEGDHKRSGVTAAMLQVVIKCQGRGEGAGTVGVAVILYGGGGKGVLIQWHLSRALKHTV